MEVMVMQCMRMSLGRRLTHRRALTIALIAVVGWAGLSLLSGCGYDPSRGDPVGQWHYEHTIFVRNDYSQVSIQTYINRTQWSVGLERKDLYDGDRDGALATAGLDRVTITNYVKVEDPPEKSEIKSGEISEYDAIFKEILAAAKAGKKDFKIAGRTYVFRFITLDTEIVAGSRLG
jgi:hypothetical protein